MRLAVLDDYQNFSQENVAWSGFPDLSVVTFKDHVYTEKDLIARLQGFDVVMRIRERTEFSKEVLQALPDLKLILATGMRNARSIDLKACDDLDITVCATDALHQTTVELTIWLMISAMRNLPRETGSLRNGGWQVGVGRTLSGGTLGIVGLGNMGKPVAQIAQLMGMNVIAWSRNLTAERAAPFGVQAVSKEELFRRSDVITLHLPHADSTEHTVGAPELALMKPDAVLINTARPMLIDEDAVVAALKEGRLGGLGLDVYMTEPLPRDHPFRTHPAVVATPHIGFVVDGNMKIFFETTQKNLRAYLDGAPINTITNDRPFLPDSQVAQQMHAQKLSKATSN